jgi:WD40 repeat protein/DNA-binding SARP family transcriptional activator
LKRALCRHSLIAGVLEIRVLGPLEVSANGHPLALGGRKPRAVLAILALRSGETVSTDRLIDGLWGERAPATASKLVQLYVSQLRKALATNGNEAEIVTRGRGYELQAGAAAVDVARFERLVTEGAAREALALWRGPALDDLADEPFAAAEIRRLEELRLAAVEVAVEDDLEAGRHRELVAELDQLVAEHPLRERLHAQRMLAFYRCGRQAEALEAYRQARARLVEEIGVEPGPELRRLHEAILRQDPSLERSATGGAEIPPERDPSEAEARLAAAAAQASAERAHLRVAEDDLAGSVAELQGVRERAREESEPHVVVCPFKGLASFEVEEAEVFFGREQLTAEMVARLVGAPFLGVVGPSGSGKSSALKAGLLAALAAGVLPGSERWALALLRPGEHPVLALERAMADPVPGGRLVIAVDQFEEVFTACRDEAERAAFVDALLGAARDPDLRALVLVAVRADFYGRCAASPELSRLLGANHVLVGPMRRDELRRAIELPARHARLEPEPALVDRLIADVEGEPGALPLLSTALLELWQQREGRRLHLSTYEQLGGVHGAVARLAERAYDRLDPERREVARRILLRLAGEGQGERVVRRRVPLAELEAEHDERVGEVLTMLAADRLVTIGEGEVEVAHEALLREWPRLRGWLEEDADGRRLHQHLAAAARDWHAAGRDPGELYRGARLATALEWSAAHAPELNAGERAFLDASRRAGERSQRRLRALLAGVAVLLAAAVVGGVLAVIQRGEAREAAGAARDAETAQLAQRLGAQALVEEDRDLSLLLARQAVAIDDSPQTRGYLLAALRRSPAAVGIMNGRGGVLRAIAVSPDGKTLAIGDLSGALFFDARTNEQIGDPLPAAGDVGVESLAYSPDGRTLAVGGDHVVRLVDARTHEQLAETAVGGVAARMAFTKDGSQLVVLFPPGEATGLGGADAQITVRDAASLEPIGTPIEPNAFVGAYVGFYYASPHFAITPDDRSLITASEEGELAWWDLRSGKKTRTVKIATGLHALALSPDGLTAAVGVKGGLQLVDLRSEAVRAAAGNVEGRPNWVSFSPDGETVVSTNVDGTVTLWDVESATPRETLRGHSNDVEQPAFSPDGETLYTVSHDGTAIAWDLTGKRGLGRHFTFTHDRTFSADGFDAHPGEFSPDGQLIAVGLKERGIALWDARELTPIGAPLLETGGEVKTLAFTPDGRTLAAGTNSSVTLWDVRSRSRLHGPLDAGDAALLVGVGFSPDGSTLATASDELGVRLWDVATGASLGAMGNSSDAHDLAFSVDGTTIAWARPQRGGAEAWDVATRTSIATVDGTPLTELSVALSPDGRILAVGGFGGVVRLWDVGTRKVVHELDQGGSGALTLEFSPDGRVLAVSGFEPFASLWDVATGTRIGPELTAGDRRAMIDLSSDGRRLLMTHGNGQGGIWDVDPTSWAGRACTLANRTLTREEWEEFLPGRDYDPAC